MTLVRSTRTHLSLDRSVAVDHHRALDAARRLLDPAADLLDDELELPTGELLPDWYEEWVAIERERFRFLRLNALEQLCLRLAKRGRLGEAVDAGLSAVAAEPLRESAHRVLVRVHIAAGNWWDALRQYESYRSMLAEQLDLPPSDEMEALIRPIRPIRRRDRRSGSLGTGADPA
jgi:DNA-binding SARP family transcriptional activator